MRHSERKDRNALIDRGPQIRPFIGTRFFHAEYVTLKKALGPLSKAELARFYTEGSIDIPAGLAFDAVDEYITRVTLLRKMAKLRAWAFTDMQARREYRCYRRILAPFIPEERDVFEPGWRFWAALGLYANKGGKP